MRKLTTGLLIAASALAIAGCEPKKTETAETTEATTAEATPVASDDATTATDAADPNGNPIKP